VAVFTVPNTATRRMWAGHGASAATQPTPDVRDAAEAGMRQPGHRRTAHLGEDDYLLVFTNLMH
jgi:hypothetical protein